MKAEPPPNSAQEKRLEAETQTAQPNGIQTLSPQVSVVPQGEATVLQRSARYLRNGWSVGVLALSAVAGIWFLFRPLNGIGSWLVGTYLMLPVVAGIAYRVRREHRDAYGVLEFGVGFVTGANVFVAKGGEESIKLLAGVAAIYIMVGGLESIAIGFPELAKKPFWMALFGKDTSQSGG